MSLANSPDCLLRPEDQALQALFPAMEQSAPNSFDDLFSVELYEVNEDIKSREDSEDNVDFFVSALTNDNESGHIVADQSQDSSQPWRKGLWCLKPGSQLIVEKTRKAQNAPPPNISPAHLIANDNFALRGPRGSTRQYQTNSLSPNRLRKPHCPSPFEQQRVDRDTSLSPSPMYSRSFYNDRSGFVDVWQQDLQDFNINLNDDYPESFPIIGDNLIDQLDCNYSHPKRSFMGDNLQMERIRSATMFNMSHPVTSKQISDQELSSRMNMNLSAAQRNMFSGTPDQNDPSYRFLNDDLPPMSDWTATESLHSSNSSHNSHNSHFSTGSTEDSHNGGLYNTMPTSEVWSPPTLNTQVSSVQDQYLELMQPKPRRATHQVLQAEHINGGGLGIAYPTADEIGVAIPYQPAEVQHMPTHHRSSSYHQRHQPKHSLASYPPLPPPVHTFPDSSPFSTPRRRATAPSRSPSPSVSPTRAPRSARSPSRRDTSQHRRAKSIHRSGPKGAETPRHRSASRGRQPRTPKTPKNGADSHGQISFVNFTPSDAGKLLNDVAPSGSSKTRARREQEARERRKKLSEAAIAAVRRAGGDVEALERAILT
ncbi:hypothetical protein LTR05_002745 [Lithohypha guttulata]|uniref:Developmental regulatory protein wetA n=1 Tax=Lithohypha guttulata TaxID=1690604 RepID=A0AAN7Y8B4_9EURO|nr:hypothetical protein LTR05_002745 [Lithohypha guttulata]